LGRTFVLQFYGCGAEFRPAPQATQSSPVRNILLSKSARRLSESANLFESPHHTPRIAP
jgi:hypothetical protein